MNQQVSEQPIKGYRDLSKEEIEAINGLKDIGVLLEEAVKALRSDAAVDQRWVSIGATDLQTGLMALVRSIAQPTTF